MQNLIMVMVVAMGITLLVGGMIIYSYGGNIREEYGDIEGLLGMSLVKLKSADITLDCASGSNYQLKIKNFLVNYYGPDRTKMDVKIRIFGSEETVLSNNQVNLPMRSPITQLASVSVTLPTEEKINKDKGVVLTLMYWMDELETGCYHQNRGLTLLDIASKCPGSYLGSDDVFIPKENIKFSSPDNQECATDWVFRNPVPDTYGKEKEVDLGDAYDYLILSDKHYIHKVRIKLVDVERTDSSLVMKISGTYYYKYDNEQEQSAELDCNIAMPGLIGTVSLNAGSVIACDVQGIRNDPSLYEDVRIKVLSVSENRAIDIDVIPTFSTGKKFGWDIDGASAGFKAFPVTIADEDLGDIVIGLNEVLISPAQNYIFKFEIYKRVRLYETANDYQNRRLIKIGEAGTITLSENGIAYLGDRSKVGDSVEDGMAYVYTIKLDDINTENRMLRLSLDMNPKIKELQKGSARFCWDRNAAGFDKCDLGMGDCDELFGDECDTSKSYSYGTGLSGALDCRDVDAAVDVCCPSGASDEQCRAAYMAWSRSGDEQRIRNALIAGVDPPPQN
ncbi:MAG: hypothetical protein ABIG30_03885 [Candidatus Aenigmatarchaeota archaeon]